VTLATLDIEQQGRTVYAKISGDIDMSNAADLRTELSARTPNGAHGLIVDLREVDYLDSAGLHMLHHLREDLRAGGQRLRLVIPAGSPVNQILRLAGIDWDDDVTDTIEAARAGIDT
jgi:anti-sigma B factor antagonist